MERLATFAVVAIQAGAPLASLRRSLKTSPVFDELIVGNVLQADTLAQMLTPRWMPGLFPEQAA